MKLIKKIMIVLLGLFLLLVIGLKVYSLSSYEPLQEMYQKLDEIGLDGITFSEDFNELNFSVDNPKKNIVFIPGGLVEPESYLYLATLLAREGYEVTISKALFNLPIFTPNYSERFLREDVDNVVIGHSLGGVVGSIMASGNNLVQEVILMGAYPIKDLSDKDVLFLTAEHDDGMDPESFKDSLSLAGSYSLFGINGGNHAQFGWYGPQKGDGDASISTLNQQNIVIEQILNFIK